MSPESVKCRSHIRCALLRGALLCVAFRSTAACFSVMNIHNVEKTADDDEDDVLLLTATYCVLRLRQVRREKCRFWVHPIAANREQQGDYGNFILELCAGQVVYGSARKSYLNILEPVAKQALRICLGAYRISPVSSLQVLAHEPPLELRREQVSLQYCT